MAAPDRKVTTALTNHYVKSWEARYKRTSSTNRFAAHWNFLSVLDHLSKDQVIELLDFYFTTPSKDQHSLDTFFWKYDKLIDGLTKLRKDQDHRAKVLEESRIRTEKWREKYGNKGIANA